MPLFRPDDLTSSTLPDKDRKKRLHEFEVRQNLRFRRLDLLNLAFIHRSHSQEQTDTPRTNERLEFLGDSVLGLIVAEHVFLNYPDKSEGELARIKSFVVSEDTLARLGAGKGIPDLLLLGKGEEMSGGRQKKAILADAFEALVGALFLDAGLEKTREFVMAVMAPEIEAVISERHRRDFKTMLQERCQKDFKTIPRYVITDRTGPDHQRIYHMSVQIGERQFGPAPGSNKKEAEQGAAALAWKVLFGDEDETESLS